jgi:serine O-acetyltransferase
MFERVKEDIRAVKERDPAAVSTWSVLLNYPGLHAVWCHRITGWLWRHNRHGLARFGSQQARFFTGVEIHPGATIGNRFFIDHGMGVVIGETTVIGEDVTLYQGVTLGGTGKERGKRHPTLEDCVVVGVGAAVLGDITIGRGSRVGGGAVVVNDVPPNCTVVGIPGRVVVREGEKIDAIDLHHEDLPDPVVEMFRCMQRRIDRLEARLSRDEAEGAEHGQPPFPVRHKVSSTGPDEESGVAVAADEKRSTDDATDSGESCTY